MGSDESYFNVSVGSDGQSHKTVSTNHNLSEEKGEPKTSLLRLGLRYQPPRRGPPGPVTTLGGAMPAEYPPYCGEAVKNKRYYYKKYRRNCTPLAHQEMTKAKIECKIIIAQAKFSDSLEKFGRKFGL